MVNGIFVDWWTIGHIFVGFIYAGIFFFGIKKFWISFFTTLLLNIFWEVWEIFNGVPEVLTNGITDIIFSLLAFVFFWKLFYKYDLKIRKMKFTFHERFFDIWSISHFFSGIISAIVFIKIGLNFYLSFAITLIIAILWEFSEQIRKVGEKLKNQLGDIVFCLAGFFLIFYLKVFYDFTPQMSVLLISVLLMFFIKSLAHKKTK